MPSARTLTLALALAAITGCDRGDHPTALNYPAPPFTLNDGTHTFSLSQTRGRVVVLNFWASWCPPCLQELPSIEALQQQLPQIQVVGISFDTDRPAYDRFLTRNAVSILTVIDPTQHTNTLYSTFRPPETYIIDKSGTIRRKFIGPQDWTSPEILDYLRKLST